MSGRDTRIDVAKGALIVLVVLGHFLVGSMGTSTVGHGTGWEEEPQRFILTTVYLAHMPLFIFFVGVTAKSDRLMQRIAKLLVLLFSLHAAYVVALRLVTGEWPTNAFVAPYWVLWFLAAMVWWLIALPLVQRAPRLTLAASVLGVAFVGFAPIDGYIATFSRSVIFLPFFIIGHGYGRRLLDVVGRIGVPGRVAAAGVLLVLATEVWTRNLDRQWMFGSQTFDQLGVDPTTGMTGRLSMLAITLIASACWLCLIPQRAPLLERPGRNSLAIYALHPVALLIYQRTPEPFGPDSFSAPVQAAIATVLALLVVALLALPIFDRSLRRYSDKTVKALQDVVR